MIDDEDERQFESMLKKADNASVGNRERLPPTFAEFPHLVIDVTQNFNKDLFSSWFFKNEYRHTYT